MPDDHSKLVPPLPIPNSTVKRLSADDSAATSVKVGHRQAVIQKTPVARKAAGVFALGDGMGASGWMMAAACLMKNVAGVVDKRCISLHHSATKSISKWGSREDRKPAIQSRGFFLFRPLFMQYKNEQYAVNVSTISQQPVLHEHNAFPSPSCHNLPSEASLPVTVKRR